MNYQNQHNLYLTKCQCNLLHGSRYIASAQLESTQWNPLEESAVKTSSDLKLAVGTVHPSHAFQYLFLRTELKMQVSVAVFKARCLFLWYQKSNLSLLLRKIVHVKC